MLSDQQRAELVADQALTMTALMDGLELGAWIGAMIATSAAQADKTPLQLLAELVPQMPDDETWNTELAERTKRKARNATRWYKGAKIEFVGRGNQG